MTGFSPPSLKFCDLRFYYNEICGQSISKNMKTIKNCFYSLLSKSPTVGKIYTEATRKKFSCMHLWPLS